MSPQTRRLVRRIHRALGLLVGLQLLMWVSGGLIMSAFDIDTVRGEHRRQVQAPQALSADEAYLSPQAMLAAAGGEITALELGQLLGRPVYRLDGAQGDQLFDARSGERLSPLSEELARQLALADYAGEGALVAAEWITEPALEYRGRALPLWRLRFDDDLDTTLYVSPATGKVVARRNDIWRLFDFVWMLHIMDYGEREDFNNPLLIAFAASALAFVFSGLLMLWLAYRPSRSQPAG